MLGESIKRSISSWVIESECWEKVYTNPRDVVFKVRANIKPNVEQLVFTNLIKSIREF